jgi:hypothetical protein
MEGSRKLAAKVVEHVLASLKSHLLNIPLELALNSIVPSNEETALPVDRDMVQPAPTRLRGRSQKPLLMLASRAIFHFVVPEVLRLRAPCIRSLGRTLPSPFAC